MSDKPLRTIDPCGCVHEITMREGPALNMNSDPPGQPILNEDGTFKMEPVEDVQTNYCASHGAQLAAGMEEIHKALASGMRSDEVLAQLGPQGIMNLLGAGDLPDEAPLEEPKPTESTPP